MTVRQIFVFILVTAAAMCCNAQNKTAFSPPGAEWHYEFVVPGSFDSYNEKVRYSHDSTVNGLTVKVLKHTRFFSQVNTTTVSTTCIRQQGDTVFMLNGRTLGEWQMLYVYNALPGTWWINSFAQSAPPSTAKITYTVLVDSIGSEMMNGFLLNTAYMKYRSAYSTYTSKVYARFGTMGFLFNYRSHAAIHGDYYSRFLCYEDWAFPLMKFHGLECSYHSTGIAEEIEEKAGLYPNPVSGHVSISRYSLQKFEVSDMRGTVLLQSEIPEGATTADLSQLPAGIYSVKLFHADGRITLQRLIRQ